MTDKIVVLSTCANLSDAERLARALVSERLAACVNVIPQIRSYYLWKGKLESAAEFLLIIKSSRELFDALRLEVEKLHPYEVQSWWRCPLSRAENYMIWLARISRGGAANGALLFDMDGVIVDSNPMHRRAWEFSIAVTGWRRPRRCTRGCTESATMKSFVTSSGTR